MQGPSQFAPQYGAPAPSFYPARKGLAITSVVLGILSIPTLGLCFVGAIAGITLGIIALNKAKANPAEFGGRGLAIGGITTSVLALCLGIPGMIGAIAIPNLLKARQAANEAGAIGSVRAIGTAEYKYQQAKGRGNFGDLRALAAEGLIDATLASGQRNGYIFSVEATKVNGYAIFDVIARPLSDGSFGTGSRTYASNETYVIYAAPGSVALKGTATNREPRGGVAIH